MSEKIENIELDDNIKEQINQGGGDSIIDPLDDLVNANLTEGHVSLEEGYEMLNLLERETQDAKDLEAENVIDDLSPQYVPEDFKVKIEKSIETVESFFAKYNVKKDEVKNMSESEKTKVFAIGSFLTKNVGAIMNDLLFDITITREEFKFIDTASRSKLSYDGNDVFNIIDLNEKYLKHWKEQDGALQIGRAHV